MKTTKKTIRVSSSEPPYFREVEARVFTMNGVELALNPKDEYHEFTHVLSGFGFNGDGSRTVKGIEKSIQALEKRMGKRKAWSTLKKHTQSLDEYIEIQKSKGVEKQRRQKAWKHLSKVFGFTLPLDGYAVMASNMICLDVLKLEQRLSQNFNLKDKSLKQVISENYGKDNAELVESML